MKYIKTDIEAMNDKLTLYRTGKTVEQMITELYESGVSLEKIIGYYHERDMIADATAFDPGKPEDGDRDFRFDQDWDEEAPF